MKNQTQHLGHRRLLNLSLAVLGFLPLLQFACPVSAQTLTLANPHWNITLTDAGYSDLLLDNTPGFEGREYLSGEWGAAVGYQRSGGQSITPQWLEPRFVFPDWPTHSPFQVVTPITHTGLNADNLPMAQSVIANSDLEITLRHEMLDTIVGTPMGTTPASSTNAAASLASSRYVLKQTATIRNSSGAAISGVQFFQFLHGLTSERGVYDNRLYPGPLSHYPYDVTQAGVDTAAVGAGSSAAGLEDYIGFHAAVAPSAFELGYYGIEGNGVDAHSVGKPSDGVHLSVENNWQTPPYSARQGTDNFRPATRWIAGAQRWDLGNLAVGQSVSLDLLLSVRSGTRVTSGTGSAGGCNGGASVPGGVDYEFEMVSSEGACFGEYSQADEHEIEVHVAAGDFGPLTFLTPGGLAQIWEMSFSGAFAGNVLLTFGYDPTILPPGFDQSALCLYQYQNGAWQPLTSILNPVTHTIAVTTDSLGAFALGVDALVTVAVNVHAAPSNSGTVTGAGLYAQGASVSLAAAANAGYVFSNWTENGSVVSTSPSYTFLAQADRALVVNFVAVGAACAISTSSLPGHGGATTGDGAYALGSSATVSATAGPGYKFSKWLENGAVASLARDYTFDVTGDRALVAKFKPVYAVVLSAEPPEGGQVEADPAYEMGELAKLKAIPSPGWSFVNWTQNGVTVSTAPQFQFNVTGHRELVGHFALGHRIDVVAEPVNGGTVTGGGVWGPGANVVLEATAHPGYVFVNWTDQGVPVGSTPLYCFTCDASRRLVANFIAQPALHCFVKAPGTLTLAWPAGATGWVLQECSDLALGNWTNSTRNVDVVGGQKQATLSPLTGNGFFRLAHP